MDKAIPFVKFNFIYLQNYQLNLLPNYPYYYLNCRKLKSQEYKIDKFSLILLPECDEDLWDQLWISLDEVFEEHNYIYISEYRYYPPYISKLNDIENVAVLELNEENSEVLEKHLRRGIRSDRGPLEIVAVEGGGLGVITHKFLPKRTLISPYLGEVQTENYFEANRKPDQDDSFELIDSKHSQTTLIVNPTKYTNLGRFINGSSVQSNRIDIESNVCSQLVAFKGNIYIILFAARDILIGEQLIYDYNRQINRKAK